MMTEAHVLEMTSKAMTLIVYISIPTVLTATLVGVAVSLVQALTQVQEQTLSFAVKLIAVFIVLAMTLRWAGAEVKQFSEEIFDSFPKYIREG